MRMQVILDSSFRPPEFSPYMGAGRQRRVQELDYFTVCLLRKVLSIPNFEIAFDFDEPLRVLCITLLNKILTLVKLQCLQNWIIAKNLMTKTISMGKL